MNKLTEKIRSVIRDVPDFPSKGILFKDITPLLQNASLLQDMVRELTTHAKKVKPDAIAGIESRGFLLGIPLAISLDIPFIPIRKAGKLPYHVLKQSYDLEYGSATIEMHTDALQKGDRVLIHDDVLATGGTAVAAAQLIEQIGTVVGFSFIAELAFLKGKNRLGDTDFQTLISY
ncbi:MAG: adenine phosphoribosyltransferase [Cyclobacteriaceae bacterium]